MSLITPEMLSVYEKDFADFDVNGNGVLEADECLALASFQLGHQSSSSELTEFMKAVDLNGDGKITIDEYLKTVLGDEWEVRTARSPRRRRGASVVDNFTKDDVSVLRQLFNNIVSGESDASGEEYLLGKISCNVLEAFLVSEGFSKERDHIVEMIQVLDLQGTDKVTFDSFRAGAACGYWPATLAAISRVIYGKVVEVVDSIYNTGQYMQRLGTGGALVAVLFHLTSHNSLSVESSCEHWQLRVNKSKELKVEFEQLALTFPEVLCVAVDSTKTGNSLTAESEEAKQFPFVKLFLDGAELEVEHCDLKTSIAKHIAAQQKTSMFALINQDDYTAALGRKDTSSGVG